MRSRPLFIGFLSLSVLLLCVIAVIPVAGTQPLQLNPPEQQTAISDLVNERFTATASAQTSIVSPFVTESLTPIPTLTLMPTATREGSFAIFNTAYVSESIVMLVNEDAFQYYSEGWEQYWQGNLRAADGEFDDAIALEPEWSEAYFARAINHFLDENYENALEDLNTAADLLGYSDLGITSWRIYLDVEFGDIQAAIRDGENLLAEMPYNAVGLYYLATAYFLDGQYELALETLDVALQYATPDLPSFELRRLAYEELGLSDDSHFESLLVDGIEAATNDEFDDAIEALSNAVQTANNTRNRDFNVAIANWNLAVSHYLGGNRRESLDALENAAEAYPEMGNIYYLQGIIIGANGRSRDYLETLNTGIELDPDFPNNYVSRGAFYESTDQDELALADYWHYLQLKQGHSLLWQSIDPLEGELRVPFFNGWEHRFVINAKAGEELTVTAVETSIGNSYVDPIIVILSPDGTPIAAADDRNSLTLDSEISRLSLPENGQYTIIVGVGPGGSSGMIEVEVELD